MLRLLSRLYIQLLIALAIGVLVGMCFPHFAAHLKPLADLFIRLIRMLLAPIVFAAIVVGIAKMGDIKSVGRVGLKSLFLFEILSGLALLLGLAVVNIFHPGSGMHINPASLDAAAVSSYTQQAKTHTVLEFFLNIVPTSFAGAFTDGNMLQVVFISVLFGIALARVGAKARELVSLIDQFLHVMFAIVRIVMWLAPLAAFGSMAYIVGTFGVDKLRGYAVLVACLYLTSLLFIIAVLGPLAHFAGFSLAKFLRYIREEILITFGTCSTESVLPQMMTKLEELGCPAPLVGMVLPAGYTFNACGTSIYLTMAAVFLAQAMDIPMSLPDQLFLLMVLLLTSKGSAGVAGSGFVILAATLSSTGRLPVAGLVLLLGAESFLNQARAVTNVIGNGVATIVIAKWEGGFNPNAPQRTIEIN